MKVSTKSCDRNLPSELKMAIYTIIYKENPKLIFSRSRLVVPNSWDKIK